MYVKTNLEDNIICPLFFHVQMLRENIQWAITSGGADRNNLTIRIKYYTCWK